MNGLSSLDETYREYLLAPTDDLNRFWRSKVKVTAVHQSAEGASKHLLVRIFFTAQAPYTAI